MNWNDEIKIKNWEWSLLWTLLWVTMTIACLGVILHGSY